MDRQLIAAATMALTLVKPDGFDFRAGQYVELVLSSFHSRDREGNSRTFSLASAPYGRDLQIAMRMNGTGYKRFLADAPPGTTVELRGPAGEFQLDENGSRPAVLLAGGIGIAPFLSMIRQAVHDRSERQIYLFYSNRYPNSVAYLSELKDLESCHRNLHVVPTITGENCSPGWHGETGHLTPEILRRYLPGGSRPLFSICGPSRFVAGMLSLTAAMDAFEADVQLEDFGEY